MKANLYFEEHTYTNSSLPIKITQFRADNSFIDLRDFPVNSVPELLFDDDTGNTQFNTAQDKVKFENETNLLPDTIPSDVVFPETLFFHAHRYMEITQIIKGNVLYFANKQIFNVSEGDIIIFNSLIPHAWLVRANNDTIARDFSFISGNIIFSDEIKTHSDFLFSFVNSNISCLHIKKENNISKELDIILDYINNEYTKKTMAFEIMIKAKLMEFFTHIARMNPNLSSNAPIKKHESLNKALYYINENLHNNITLEDIANICFMSPQYFSYFFKKNMGVNFSYYLNKLRIEKVISLLRDTDESILNIAVQCGFNTLSNFYRVWDKFYHINPSKLRGIN